MAVIVPPVPPPRMTIRFLLTDPPPAPTGACRGSLTRRVTVSWNSIPASIERRSGHARDAGQALELFVGQVAAELDRDVEPARSGVVVVVDGDAHVAELPALGAPVQHEPSR